MKKIIFIFAFCCVAVVGYAQLQLTRTIHTRGGQSVQVQINPEYTQRILNQLLDDAIDDYPNATYVAPPTLTYNCHFYAWCKTDSLVSGNYWLNQYIVTNQDTATHLANLSKFWTDDCYGETTEPNAEKIFYYNSDHSAVDAPSVVDKYISKWGAGPVMMHAPGYGPYLNMHQRCYYYDSYNPAHNPIVTYGTITCSNGTGTIGVGVAANYFTPFHTSNSITMECCIETAKGDDALELGCAVINGIVNGGYNVTFNTPGIYEMYIYFYNKSNQVICDYTFEPIVVP